MQTNIKALVQLQRGGQDQGYSNLTEYRPKPFGWGAISAREKQQHQWPDPSVGASNKQGDSGQQFSLIRLWRTTPAANQANII